MKPNYQVHMFNSGVPVSAQDPIPPGADAKHFDALADAQAFAEAQKCKWLTVRLCARTQGTGVFEEIGRYQEGRYYETGESR